MFHKLENNGYLDINTQILNCTLFQTECMRKEDRIGISSLVFTPTGEAFYQCSSSELQRVSVAAAHHLELKSKLQIAPDVR